MGVPEVLPVVAQCSFCRKPESEVHTLIEGPSVYICDECVARCSDIIAEEIQHKQPPAAPDHVEGQPKIPLGEMLVSARLIRQDQLDMALAEQHRTGGLLGETLVGLGFVSPRVIAQVVSTQTGIPRAQLDGPPVALELFKIVPEEVCRKYRLVPLDLEGNVLRLAMANPLDAEALDHVRLAAGRIPLPTIAPWTEILRKIVQSTGPRPPAPPMDDLDDDRDRHLPVLRPVK